MWTLLFAVGFLIAAGVYLFIWGGRASREREEYEILKRKVEVDSKTREDCKAGDERVAARRAAVREFVRSKQVRKVRKAKQAVS